MATRRRSPSSSPSPSPGGHPSKLARADAPTISALPADLIRLVFSYVPLRGRLFVLNRVCRRWQSLARESITELPEAPRLDLRRAVETFSLATLTIRKPAPVALPATVTSLRIAPMREECVCHMLPNVTRLVRLDAFAVQCCSCSVPLIRSNSQSLTRLAIVTSAIRAGEPREDYALLFANVELPQLRTLTIRLESRHDWAVSLLLPRVAAQLTELGVYVSAQTRLHANFVDAICSSTFPALETLKIFLNEPTSRLPRLLKAAPRLASLSLRSPFHDDVAIAVALVAPVLVQLTVEENSFGWPLWGENNDIYRLLWQNLAACTRLKKLVLPNFNGILTRDTWQLMRAARFEVLNPLPAYPLEELLSVCTSLKTLTVSQKLVLPVPMPHLNDLHLTSPLPSLDASVACIEAALRQCPRLREIELRMPSAWQEADVARLQALLHRAERAGVCLVTVNEASYAFYVACRELARELRWLELRVEQDSEYSGDWDGRDEDLDEEEEVDDDDVDAGDDDVDNEAEHDEDDM